MTAILIHCALNTYSLGGRGKNEAKQRLNLQWKVCTFSGIFFLVVVGLRPLLAGVDEAKLQERIPRFVKVDENLYRGGQPSLDSLALVKEAGIQRIINLRHEKKWIEKERQEAERVGIQYYPFPWNSLTKPKGTYIDDILVLLGESKQIPTYVHCKRGRDRTGFIIGCYRVRFNHWEPELAYDEMQKLGFRTFYFGHLKESLYELGRKLGYAPEKIGLLERFKIKMLTFFYSFRRIIPMH